MFTSDIQNRIEYILFISLVKFFNLLGLETGKKDRILSCFSFLLCFPNQKGNSSRNLKIAFPEKADAEINE